MTVFLVYSSLLKGVLAEDWAKDLKFDKLQSYAYVGKSDAAPELYHHTRSLLIDSGAFTFISKKGTDIPWEEYVDRYADFVRKIDARLYLELDIDSIVGYPRVLELRRRLEKRVGWPSIPVWHVSRGKEDFVRMCEAYSYVAFGGIITDGRSTTEIEKYFPWFINVAHRNKAKIHALGYTCTSKLHRLHFDSVDSSSWVCGGRFSTLHNFNPEKGVIEYVHPGKEYRYKNLSDLTRHNFQEWIKFQNYARTKL